MTTVTKEQQKQILIDTANHVISRDNTSPYSENLRELARIALALLTVEPVSFDSLNAAVAEVTGCNQHTWNAAIYKGHHPVPSMNYNSLARIVDMYRSPQPTPAISCPKPVVKLPTTRCWAGISNFYYAADVIAAIRAAGVEVSND